MVPGGLVIFVRIFHYFTFWDWEEGVHGSLSRKFPTSVFLTFFFNLHVFLFT